MYMQIYFYLEIKYLNISYQVSKYEQSQEIFADLSWYLKFKHMT